jgi:hypothetical protein
MCSRMAFAARSGFPADNTSIKSWCRRFGSSGDGWRATQNQIEASALVCSIVVESAGHLVHSAMRRCSS